MPTKEHLIIVISVFFTGYLGASLHELTHYFVSGIWTKDRYIVFAFGIVPAAVDFGSPYELPNRGVRIAGIAPIVWPACAIYSGVVLYPFTSFINILIILLFAFASIISPIDLLALLYPNTWKEITEKEQDTGHIEAGRILLAQLRDTVS